MHEEEQAFIQKAFATNWAAPLGPNVDQFEIEMANTLGCQAAAALISGTAALHLAIKLAGVAPGDFVFCSDLTFVATVNPVCYEKAIPVFIDSERSTWNLDPEALEVAFQKYDGVRLRRPKAVILANLYGTPAKLEQIQNICRRYNTPLIEDAAESLGALYNGKQTGTFGAYNAISFNGNKIITSSGGGMLLSDDESAIAKARFWATQARDPVPWYQHSETGYNYRMSNVVAGIGRGQLMHLEEHIALKSQIYQRYRHGLKGFSVTMNPYLNCSKPNFWLSCMTIDPGCPVTPDQIRLKLEDQNIESRPIWKPMHLQPVFHENDFISTGDDVGADIFSRGLCLPSDIKMTPEEQTEVIQIIQSCF